jgi:hypothetical protein
MWFRCSQCSPWYQGESAEDIQTTIKNLRQTDRDRHDKIKTLEGKVEEQTRILNSAEVPDQAKAAEVDRKRVSCKITSFDFRR